MGEKKILSRVFLFVTHQQIALAFSDKKRLLEQSFKMFSLLLKVHVKLP